MKSKKFPKAPKLPEPHPKIVIVSISLAIILILLIGVLFNSNVSLWTLASILIISSFGLWAAFKSIFGD